MELNISNISKVIPVECGKCSHSNVCRYKTEIEKGTNNISDKNMKSDSPFVLTLTCKFKQDSVITPKGLDKPEKKDDENIKDIVSNAIQEALNNMNTPNFKTLQRVNAGDTTTVNYNYSKATETQPGSVPTVSGVPTHMASNPETTDSRSAEIKQLEELAMRELQNNAEHNVQEKVLTKKKKH